MSEKFKLNKQDMKKVGKGALIALGGTILTILQEAIPNIDFGKYTVIVVGLNSVLVNFIRLWVAGK